MFEFFQALTAIVANLLGIRKKLVKRDESSISLQIHLPQPPTGQRRHPQPGRMARRALKQVLNLKDAVNLREMDEHQQRNDVGRFQKHMRDVRSTLIDLEAHILLYRPDCRKHVKDLASHANIFDHHQRRFMLRTNALDVRLVHQGAAVQAALAFAGTVSELEQLICEQERTT